ncbi:MAG: single-stranded DNA-binding protein [Treponema sp.]|nr:single-stranded DNA-binding protein [Treponema sp.]
MLELNTLQVYGRIVRDATMKKNANGMSITEFSLANNQAYRDEKGEIVQTAHFFPLAIYGTYAEKMLPHLKKGQRVIIEGWVKQNRWATKEGEKRSATAIGVRRIHLIFDSKKHAETPQNTAQNAPAPEITADDEPNAFDEEQIQGIYESEPESGDFDTDGIF